jgi:hypothetical protein
VGPLPPEHGGQQVRVAGLGGRHHLEEEVVPVPRLRELGSASQRLSSSRPAGRIS